jgi:hypothetical protein
MIDTSKITEATLEQLRKEGKLVTIDLNEPDWFEKLEFAATGKITKPMDPNSQEYKDFVAAHPL